MSLNSRHQSNRFKFNQPSCRWQIHWILHLLTILLLLMKIKLNPGKFKEGWNKKQLKVCPQVECSQPFLLILAITTNSLKLKPFTREIFQQRLCKYSQKQELNLQVQLLAAGHRTQTPQTNKTTISSKLTNLAKWLKWSPAHLTGKQNRWEQQTHQTQDRVSSSRVWDLPAFLSW